jgi:hypothetical protein
MAGEVVINPYEFQPFEGLKSLGRQFLHHFRQKDKAVE